MKNLLQRARKTIKIKNMLFLTIAGIINAFGITIFLNPVNLYDSGISGTAMLAAQLTPESLSLSLFLIIFTLPLFLFGLKKQGKKFTFYAIYTVAVYSFVSWLITDVLPVDVSMASPLAGTDLLLCAVFGGVISGIGSGLAIKFGGAMDGIEVMAVIFAKKIGVLVHSLWHTILYFMLYAVSFCKAGFFRFIRLLHILPHLKRLTLLLKVLTGQRRQRLLRL